MLKHLPWWVQIPRKCEKCWKFNLYEPWEMKYVVKLCRKHVFEAMEQEVGEDEF